MQMDKMKGGHFQFLTIQGHVILFFYPTVKVTKSNAADSVLLALQWYLASVAT